MEERYLELREKCYQAFCKWYNEKNDANFLAYNKALDTYQNFCVDVLEKLMKENAEVLKNLKYNP